MAVKKAAKKAAGFSAEEKAAARERAKELNASDPAAAQREAIAKMNDADREVAEKLSAIVAKAAPELQPKTWYGMPAWARANGETICYLQNANKFKTRYSTFGFSDKAKLDDGDLWPNAYAVPKVTAAVEKRISELVKKAVG